MFATLLGNLPRPPLPAGADPIELVRAALDAQAAAGLELLTDGGLWGDAGSPVERWTATAALTDLPVKAVIAGPYTTVMRQQASSGGRPSGLTGLDRELAASADAVNETIRGLAAAGCPLVDVHEPAAATIGTDDDARRRFADTQRRVLHGVTAIHATLAIVGGNADAAGIATVLAAPYASLALDLIDGPDNWRLAAAAPGSTGLVCGALSTEPTADESVEVLVWALGYAASTGGRGPDRVGLASAGSLADLSWSVAQRRMAVLGEAVRHVSENLNAMGMFYIAQPNMVSIRVLNVAVSRNSTWNSHEWDLR